MTELVGSHAIYLSQPEAVAAVIIATTRESIEVLFPTPENTRVGAIMLVS